MQNVGSCCICTAQGPQLSALPLSGGLKTGREREVQEGGDIDLLMADSIAVQQKSAVKKKQLSSDLKTNKQKKGG